MCWSLIDQGMRNHGYHDTLVVPIIENTALECELTDSLEAAIDQYPDTSAVLVCVAQPPTLGDSWSLNRFGGARGSSGAGGICMDQ